LSSNHRNQEPGYGARSDEIGVGGGMAVHHTAPDGARVFELPCSANRAAFIRVGAEVVGHGLVTVPNLVGFEKKWQASCKNGSGRDHHSTRNLPMSIVVLKLPDVKVIAESRPSALSFLQRGKRFSGGVARSEMSKIRMFKQ
jgi:hypothetical protein